MQGLIIVGGGGHAVSCADVAVSAGFEKLIFVDPRKAGETLLGFPVVASPADVFDTLAERDLFVAIGDNAARMRIAAELAAEFPVGRFPALVHRTAYVSPFASVGEGTVIMPGAIIGSNSRVGRFCIVNTGSSVDHDCFLADFASFAPRAVCGGNVRVGERSAVSIGAVIRHGVSIGSDTVIGANSYLNSSAPDLVVSYGSPAVVVRSRASGDRYL